jgi:2'-5' RNA ligase
MDLRCFIAIPVPDQIRRNIGDQIDNLKTFQADVKWVASGNLHITLKFLGATPESLIPDIKEALSRIALSYRQFSITLSGAGCFPAVKYPRVLWVGAEDSGMMARLQKEIDDTLSSFGFAKEVKIFHPHLTIGRVRSQKGISRMMGVFESLRSINFGAFAACGIHIIKSELKPKGAEYTSLHEIPFMPERKETSAV